MVLPVAVLAAALRRRVVGCALPGWLKARFGASEVINTILLNYIAASLALTRALSAAGLCRVGGSSFRRGRRLYRRRYRLELEFRQRGRGWRERPVCRRRCQAVLLLVVLIFVGSPRAGDGSVNLGLPFKAPGSEPKSYELSEAARLPQLPAIVGVPPGTFGETDVPLNLGLFVAPVAALLTFRAARRGAAAPLASSRLLLAVGSRAAHFTSSFGVARPQRAAHPDSTDETQRLIFSRDLLSCADVRDLVANVLGVRVAGGRARAQSCGVRRRKHLSERRLGDGALRRVCGTGGVALRVGRRVRRLRAPAVTPDLVTVLTASRWRCSDKIRRSESCCQRFCSGCLKTGVRP